MGGRGDGGGGAGLSTVVTTLVLNMAASFSACAWAAFSISRSSLLSSPSPMDPCRFASLCALKNSSTACLCRAPPSCRRREVLLSSIHTLQNLQQCLG